MPITLRDVQRMKDQGERIVMLTSYDFTSAQIADRAGVPLLLVGDSLGMVVLGYGSTLPVTLDDMVRHAGAVVRGSANALIVGDLPFLTYASEADAVRAAGRMMQEAGVQAVKLEGGAAMAPVVKKLVELGVPVMGHLGYTPQSTLQIGVRVQAKDDAGAQMLIADALALQAAGAFAIVLELVPAHALASRGVQARLTHPHHRHRGGGGLRRAGAGLARPAGPVRRDSAPQSTPSAFGEIGSRRSSAAGDGLCGGGEAPARFPTAAQSSSMDEAELAQALADLP